MAKNAKVLYVRDHCDRAIYAFCIIFYLFIYDNEDARYTAGIYMCNESPRMQPYTIFRIDMMAVVRKHYRLCLYVYIYMF